MSIQRSRLSWVSGGNARFPSGTPVPLTAVTGHRDTGPTSCPGNALDAQLPALARKAASLGLPKLYEPLVSGTPGGLVRFTARLSSARPWTVRVLDTAGSAVASGTGEGANVDWTWDATFAAPTGYTYSIEAGADVRPAVGTIGQVATSLTMTGAQAKPATFTPNGDSQADSTVISYTLSLASTVTATLRDASGAILATLFAEQKKAGRQSFKFTATGVADGRYSVVLNAKAPSGREANAVVPIVVDRTLAAFSVSPAVYSPNGDKRLDQLGFTFVLAAAAHVKLVAGKQLVYEGDLGAGPQELRWDGRLPDGKHAAVLEATGPFGTRGQTVRFAADTKKPVLRLLSKAQRRFTVNEQVTVTGTVGGVRVRAVVGPGPVLAFRWRRTDRSHRLGRGGQPHDDSSAVAAHPRVVLALEVVEQRGQKLRALDAASRLEQERRRRMLRALRQLLRRLVHVDPDPEDDPSFARLGEDPRHLPAVDQHVVRPLDRRGDPGDFGERLGARPARDERELREVRCGNVGVEHDRGEDARSGGRDPIAAEPTTARGLLVSGRDRADRERRLRGAAGSTRSARRRCMACRSGL